MLHLATAFRCGALALIFAAGAGNIWVTPVTAAEPRPAELTATERAWIAQHPVIRVGYDPAWAPFSFQGEHGELVGIDADVLALMSQRLGLKFQPGTRATWSEVYEAARRGEFDLLVSMARTPEREAEFRFTAPYLQFPLVIITRGREPILWTIEDLRNRRVAVPRNYATAEFLQRVLPGLELQLTSTVEEALRLVSDGDADATLTNLPNVSFLIKTKGYTNLMIAGVAPETLGPRYAVRRDWPELAGLLEKGIALVTPADRQAIDHRWIRVDYARVVRWDVVWKAAAGALGVLGLALGLIVYRNRILAREIAERIKLHREIEAAHAELTQLHEEKRSLLQMAAHDLRGPLTSVQLTLDTAKLNALPAADALKLIATQTRAMVTLLDNLLDLDELEEGRRRLQPEPIDWRAMVLAAAELHASSAERKQLRFDLAGVQAPPPVLADRHALRQILDNLFSNAVKFSPLDRAIRVELRADGAEVRFAIANDGPGVPPAEIERIFTKYHRGPAQPTAGEKSTGLGLSIVRSLANSMNGRAWCESVAGQGATFIVRLPQAPAA